MPCWYSPWPVAPTLDAHLQAAGLTRFDEQNEGLPSDALVLYAPLDALLASELKTASVAPAAQQLVEDYARLQSLSSRHSVMATWRVEALDPESIRQWLLNATPIRIHQPFPQPEPVTALLTKALLAIDPRLLESYLDLELVAELGGGAPDSRYSQRIAVAASDPQRLLDDWWLVRQQRQTSLQEQAALVARVDVLEAEKRQAHEERELLQAQFHHAQKELQRLGLAKQPNAARNEHPQDVIETRAARVNGMDAKLLESKNERDGALQVRDKLLQGRNTLLQGLDGVPLERDSLPRETDAITRDPDAPLQNLDGLSQERDLLSQERDASRREWDALLQKLDGLSVERDSLVQEREAIAQERDAEVLEKVTAVATLAGLNHQLSGQTEALRLAREAHAQQLAKVQALEGEKQQDRLTAERLQEELARLRGELDHLVAVEEDQGAQLGQLQSTLDAQTARVTVLETDLLRITNERDEALQQRDVVAQEKTEALTRMADLNQRLSEQTEALGLAREAEAQQLARAGALEGEKWQAREEVRRMLMQLHHLQEELENSFLQSQAGEQLIAAQQEQFRRAQSLMTRLLLQTMGSPPPLKAVAVEVFPPETADSGQRSLPSGGRKRSGLGIGLLRKVWPR